MLAPQNVYNLLKGAGFEFFTGVPDSLLKNFCAYVTDHSTQHEHVIAANEGNAIALAAGHYLGKKTPAFVYMQNSGIGNAINPLLSLADREVYSFPMLLMIGWRGEPGIKDEPQHGKQGRVMEKLLDAMEIPWFILDAESSAEEVLGQAIASMTNGMAPVALLVRKGTFEQYKLRKADVTDYPMSREQAIQCIVDALGEDDLVVSTTGMASRELYEYRVEKGYGSGNDFLTVGSMGHTSSIAMGLAAAQVDRRVFCMDGDGSVIMHMGSLALVGQVGTPNLVHIVFNNGAHDSVGGQPTVGFGVNLATVASACGYKNTASVSTHEDLLQFMTCMHNVEGPVFLEVCVNKNSRTDLGRPNSTPFENRETFMKRLGAGHANK
jgi:phosphonopyruvate decarboxylase